MSRKKITRVHTDYIYVYRIGNIKKKKNIWIIIHHRIFIYCFNFNYFQAQGTMSMPPGFDLQASMYPIKPSLASPNASPESPQS